MRAGVLVLRLAKEFPEVESIVFCDADLATPLDEARHVLGFHELEGGEVHAIWASRVMRAGSRIDRRFNRHLFGRPFATAAGELPGVRAYDTQCGAKLFRREVLPAVFGEEFVTRWIVDVELYHRLGHERILECPVLAGSISPTLRSASFASLRRSWGIYFASAANKIVGVKPVPISILS